jgi:putative hydrolase of the HAD superfamily
MIKLIIFDLGGILVPEKKPEILEHVAKEIGCTKEQLQQNLKEYDDALTKGEITLKEFYRKLLKRCGIERNPEEIVKKHVEEYKKVSTERNQEIIQLIEELKINYEIVALTNTEIEIGNYNRAHGLFQYFERAFLSTEMHMKKPDAMIFQKVLDECNVTEDEALFIDDKEENTEGARELGIPCILYENPKQLKKMLEIML